MRSLLFAYLDPGTGSFLAQIVIGAVVGVGVAIRAFRHNIAAFFSKLSGKGKSQTKDDV